MTTGIAIRRIRAALNLTLGQLAEFTGLPSSTLAPLERGERPLTDAVKEKLLQNFRLTPEEFAAIDVRNVRFLLEAPEGGSAVYRAVRQQCLARHELHLPPE